MSAPAPIRGRWTVRVCQHGHRVEYRENYGGWLHMDAPDVGVCDEAGVVEVVPVPDEQAIERAVQALEGWNWRSGSLTIETRMLVAAVLAAAFNQPETHP